MEADDIEFILCDNCGWHGTEDECGEVTEEELWEQFMDGGDMGTPEDWQNLSELAGTKTCPQCGSHQHGV